MGATCGALVSRASMERHWQHRGARVWCWCTTRQIGRQEKRSPNYIAAQHSRALPGGNTFATHSHADRCRPYSTVDCRRKAESCFALQPIIHHGLPSEEGPPCVCLSCAPTSPDLAAHVYYPTCKRPRHHCSPPPPACRRAVLDHGSTSRPPSLPNAIKSRRVHS